jgi:hypothetical protein
MIRLDSLEKQPFPRFADSVSVGRTFGENYNIRRINDMDSVSSTIVEGMQAASHHHVSKVRGKR